MDKYFKTRRCPLFRGFTVYGISTSKTTPYPLMSNGLPEKMDTTMINALITIPDNFKANWKDWLAKLTPILEKTYCYVTLKKKKLPES